MTPSWRAVTADTVWSVNTEAISTNSSTAAAAGRDTRNLARPDCGAGGPGGVVDATVGLPTPRPGRGCSRPGCGCSVPVPPLRKRPHRPRPTAVRGGNVAAAGAPSVSGLTRSRDEGMSVRQVRWTVSAHLDDPDGALAQTAGELDLADRQALRR